MDERDRELELEVEMLRAASFNRLADWQPHPKQVEFHAAGAKFSERCLMAGNKQGKSICGGAESAYHLTGLYPAPGENERFPDGWPGRRFAHPIVLWAAGESNEMTRDNAQQVLLGDVDEWGTGMIPAHLLRTPKMGRGCPNAVDYVQVRHVSGLWSLVRFKAFEQGRKKWQGPNVHVVWFDEEPPLDIYEEGLARTTVTKGLAFMTFTPMEGQSKVVRLFYPKPKAPQRHLTKMRIEDAKHIAPEDYDAHRAKYGEAHTRRARIDGDPQLGSGMVYAGIEEKTIVVPAREIPRHWPQIGSLDFGWDHPFAAVRLAWDRDSGTVYVTAAHKQRPAEDFSTPAIHASALRRWGDWLPWAWPHDGHVHEKAAAAPLSSLYRREGLKMLPEHATHPEGGYSTEAAVQQILSLMQAGQFKVFAHLEAWLEEFRSYHRKAGLIVHEEDDLMSATQKGVMMLRHARTVEHFIPTEIADADYDPLGGAHQQAGRFH